MHEFEIVEQLKLLREDYYRRAADAHELGQTGRGAALNCCGDDMDRLIEKITKKKSPSPS